MLITVIYIWNGAAQMNGPSVGKDVIVNYLAGISGTLLVFNVSQMLGKLPDNIRLISRNTLFIIFFHWCCLLFPFRKLFIGENVVIYVIECCLFSLIILSLNFISIKVLMNYCPFLLGKYKR